MLELFNRRRGLFVKLSSLDVVEIIARSGFDFAVVDLEHSQLAEAEALMLLRHARALKFPALVRIPALDRGIVNRALEAGACGVQLSTVRRTTEVSELLAATRYAPRGSRSISLSHPEAEFGALSLGEYLRAAESARPLIVAQIETADTVDPLEEILAAGADVAFLGMTDLTVELGLDTERTRARVEEIAHAAQRVGIPLGAFGLDDDPRVVYQLVSSDISLLREAVANAA
jgi:4-hydroxy-2-oxoheptanedioate aldolase